MRCVRWLAVGSLFVILSAGCGAAPPGGEDAGQNPVPDSGQAQQDGGNPVTDSGTGMTSDAGEEKDAGTSGTDDAGTAGSDAGTTDAGTTGSDAGTTDAGTTGSDAGAPSVPSAPTGVTVVRGNGQVSVGWTAPSSNGGSALLTYSVIPYVGASAGTAVTVAASSTSTSVTGLTNGTAYTFKVAATNAVGTGPQSAASSAVTPATTPSAPLGVSAVRGAGQATVSWSQPLSNGGDALTGYTVTPYVGTTAGTPVTVTAGVTSTVVNGLVNGLPYTFTVLATNTVGSGPESGASNAVTPATVPGAPTGVLGLRGNQQVTVSWTAPADNGGSAVLSYTVTPYDGATPLGAVTVSAPTTQAVVSGLVNGKPYTFVVVATNAVGSGGGATSGPVTPATVPQPPSSVVAAIDVRAARLSWTAPTNTGGSPITGYTVTASPGGATASTTGATAVIVPGLTNGTPYTFVVVATNAVGSSAPSGPSNAVTPGPSTVSVSGTVTYTGAKSGRVYIVLRSNGSSGTPAVGTSLAAPGAFTLDGVAWPGSYELFAWRDSTGQQLPNGSVDPIGSASVTVQGTSVTGANVTLTDAPAAVTPAVPSVDFALGSEDSALVSWSSSRTPAGHEAAISYLVDAVRVSDSAVVASRTLGAGNGNFALFGALPATDYLFRVRAQNAAGTSANAVSNTVTVGARAGGHSVSGTATFAGAATGPLYVYVFNQSAGAYFVRVPSPTSPQAFTIPHVPDGTWEMGAFVDLGNDGIIGPTDPALGGGPGPSARVSVAGADVTGLSAAFPPGLGWARVTTHLYDGRWTLGLDVHSGTKRPAKVRLVSGPNVTVPLDVGISMDSRGPGPVRFGAQWQCANGAPAPQLGDPYAFDVTFTDGTTATLTAQIDHLVPAPPTPTAPLGTSLSAAPQFTWQAPSPAPSGAYRYALRLRDDTGNSVVWEAEDLPSSQQSALYNFNGTATQAPALTGSSYTWELEARDDFGNSAAAVQAHFTVPVTVTVFPSSATVKQGATQRFVAVVTGAADPTVAWTSAGGIGTVDGSGLFTASLMASGQVTATSSADGTKSGSASVTVTAANQVQVSITPPFERTVVSGGSTTLAATVTNPFGGSTAVTWSVLESSCGTVQATGQYTAGSGARVCHVVATSVADPTKVDLAQIYVVQPLYAISGTVAYAGAKPGRIYISASMDTPSGPSVVGTSLASPGAFTLQGLPASGSAITLHAWRDPTDVGKYVVGSSPHAQTVLNFTGSSITGVALTLTDPPSTTPPMPSGGSCIGGTDSLWAEWQPVRDPNNNELPTHYRVHVSTSAAFPAGSTTVVTVLAGARATQTVVTGLAPGAYFVGVSAGVGVANSAIQPIGSTNVGTASSPTSIAGQVTFTGAPPSGPLYIVAHGTGGNYYARILAPTYPQSYAFPANAGTYTVEAFIDEGGDGLFRDTDPGTYGGAGAVAVTVSSGTATAPAIDLTRPNGAVGRVRVERFIRTWGQGYALHFDVTPGLKRPVAVTLVGGPKVSSPVDIGMEVGPYDGQQRHTYTYVMSSHAPQAGDTYQVQVTRSDNTTETLNLAVSAFTRTPPSPLTPVGTISSTQPTFSWGPVPSDRRIALNVRQGYGPSLWWVDLANGATSVAYNSNGQANPPALSPSPSPYVWTLTVEDPFGNWTTQETEFYVQ